MFKGNDKGVNHWVNGANAWRLKITGFFSRVRGMTISGVVLAFITMGTPWWWPFLEEIYSASKFSRYFDGTDYHFGSAILLSVAIIFSLFRHRARVRRSSDMKCRLHAITHHCRISVCGLLERTVDKSKKNFSKSDKVNEKFHLEAFADSFCDHVAEYFKLASKDGSVGCALRIFEGGFDSDIATVVYTTIGRGGCISKNRRGSSESIPRDVGIPKFFLSEKIGCRGVLSFHDLKKAAESNIYVMTENDKAYQDEVKYMLVAPVNGWNGRENDLIGLLYVTSIEKKILDPRHVEVMLFCSELLAAIFSSMLARLYRLGHPADG